MKRGHICCFNRGTIAGPSGRYVIELCPNNTVRLIARSWNLRIDSDYYVIVSGIFT